MEMSGSVSDAARLAADSGGVGPRLGRTGVQYARTAHGIRSRHAMPVAMRAIRNCLFLGEDRPSGAPLGPGDNGKVIGVA